MRALEIDGLFNTRATPGPTPWFVRSGSPDTLTADGERALRALGVQRIIDLREAEERTPHDHTLPVAGHALYGSPPPLTGRLEDIYAGLLRDRGHALTAAVAAIAETEGPVLIHCTAGKDRTGLVAALAQRAVGISSDDVVADYALSGPAVRPVRAAAAEDAVAHSDAVERAESLRLHLDSPPEAMRFALDLIEDRGGAAQYLLDHGLTPAQLDALRTKARG